VDAGGWLPPTLDTALRRAQLVEELDRPGDDVVRVVVLAAPADRDLLDRLRRRAVPRLLLVPPRERPPVVRDLLEDWIRLPASIGDAQARLYRLRRDARARGRPVVGGDGRLLYGRRWIVLSPRQEQIARVLAERFDDPVPLSALRGTDGRTPVSLDALRSSLHQLRRILAPLDLEIVTIPTLGYSLRATGSPQRRPA
jgi:hypothetical protein